MAVHRRPVGQLGETSANRRLTFGLHLLYASGLRLSEVVVATVDDLQWVEYPADASDDQPMEGLLRRVIGKGQKEREVPLPIDVVGELARYLESRGLGPDPRTSEIRGVPSGQGQ